MKVVYFQPAQRADFEDTLENIRASTPYVDYFVVVEDASEYHAFTIEQRNSLSAMAPEKVVYKGSKWEESLPRMYQHGVAAALELKADWIVFSDADEHFNELFFKDLKSKIIPTLEEQGFDMAGVKCHAQFAIADAVWPSSLTVDTTMGMMDLDKYPEKVVVTNDHKYMLMRLYPDLKWEGVGRTKTVHTTWKSESHPWNAVFLPDVYWYLHRKTPLQVFASAARNMWMSGGGANLGDVNTMWVELKAIMLRHVVRTWPELEYFVTKPKEPLVGIDREIVNWIQRALTWKATDYGIETRQTALWMLYYWPFLVEHIPEISAGVAHPPQVDDAVRAERKVQEIYVDVLGRWPDKEGLDRYTAALLSQELTETQVREALMDSEEYKARRALLESQTTEKFRLRLPLNIDFEVTPELVAKVFERTKSYTKVIKPKLDVGQAVIELGGPDFLERFYDLKNKGELSQQGLATLLFGPMHAPSKELLEKITQRTPAPSVNNPGT